MGNKSLGTSKVVIVHWINMPRNRPYTPKQMCLNSITTGQTRQGIPGRPKKMQMQGNRLDINNKEKAV